MDWEYRSLGELDRAEEWFRPMLVVVARRLLGEVSWGLKMRVSMGAGLSILDMATDIFVMWVYMGKEETKGYGDSLLGMIVAGMVLQLVLVFAQNKKTPLKMLKEMLIVMLGVKPAVDCYRVCAGHEMQQHHAVDPQTELVATKMIELVAESIPGCLLQLYVLLKNKNLVSTTTVGSLIVSALTTGFISASISFDYDVDPAKRKESPEFYGYIPDGGCRTVIFGCMIVNSALLLLTRSFSAAMLMLVNKSYFALYLVGDMALYLGVKAASGDFHYWLPVDSVFGLFVSLLRRVIVKTITDFTGVIQFRNYPDMGGLYWTFNMLLTLAASFGCVWIGEGGTKEWEMVTMTSGAWVVTFGLFLFVMKKEYRRTFFSTKSGKQKAMDHFLQGKDDSAKKMILKYNKKQWLKIRGEVKDWVQANWWRWEEEKPVWLTKAWIAKVPADMVPLEAEQAAKDIRATARRRSKLRIGIGVAREEVAGGQVQPVN